LRLLVPVLLLVFSSVSSPGVLAATLIPTTTTVSVDNPIVPAALGQVTWTIDVSAGASGPVTGVGTWTLSGASSGTLATNTFDPGSPIHVSASGLSADTYTLVATYPGDSTFEASSGQASATFEIVSTATTVTVDHSVVAAGKGQVQWTMAVTAAVGGPVTGTGTWTLSGPGGAIATNTFNAASPTNVSASGLAAGVYTLDVTYAGNGSFGPSSGSASATFQIVPTTVTVTVDHPLVAAGKGQVQFGIDVSAASDGPVTGTGSWTLSGATSGPIATNSFDPGAHFNVSLSGLAADTYTLTVTYPGNQTFGASSGSASTTFAIVPTTTTVTATPTTVLAGSGVVVWTVDVTPASDGPITGTGTWTLSGASSGPLSTNSFTPGSPFNVTASGLSADTYTLTVTYPGNQTFGASSGSASATFTAQTATVALSSSLNPSVAGQAVTFTATVTGSGPMPTGTITFKDGSTVLGTATLDSSGTASLSTSALTAGTHPITASYSGNSIYAAADSSGLAQVVNAPQPPVTTAALTPPANGNGWNDTPVSVTLTAVPASGGAPVAGTFYAIDNATCAPGSLGSCSTYTVPFTIATDGAHTVTFFSVDTLSDFESVKSVAVKIDQVAPATTATPGSAPNGAGWYSTPVTVSFAATDALSGVDHTEASLDAGPWTIVSGSTTVSTDGVHTLLYRSVDRAGNTESSHSLTLKIDLDKPTLTVTPAAGTPVPHLPLFALNGSAVFYTEHGKKVGTTAATCFDTKGLQLKLSATDAASAASLTYSATGANKIPSTTGAGGSATVSLTSRGLTTLTVVATDAGGNTSPTQRWAELIAGGVLPLACAMPIGTLSLPSHGFVLVTGKIDFGHGWLVPAVAIFSY
jgi:hypothetical protein